MVGKVKKTKKSTVKIGKAQVKTGANDKDKTVNVLGLVLMIVNIVFALAWLIRADLLIPELAHQLGTMNSMGDIVPNTFLATFPLFFSVLAVVLSIPFLMRVNIKSKMVRLISGILAIVPAWLWSCIAVWTFGGLGGAVYVGPAVQFTTYAPFSANWVVLIFDLIWLAGAVYVIYRMGIENIYNFGKKNDNAKAVRKSEVDVLADAIKSTKKK